MTVASHRDRALLLAVALAALLVYVGTLAYDFVWDDLILIRDRLHMYSLANLARLLFSDLFSHGEWGESFFYRPLVVLSFFVDLELWGLRPIGFHLTNVLAHVLASVCVARLATRVTASGIAGVTAGLLFAVHPVHTESVAFVSGRTDVLATLFVLVAVLAYARWRDSGTRSAGVVSVAAFGLALLSKEVAVVVPLLLALYDLVVLDDVRRAGAWARGLLRYVPYGVVLTAYLVLRKAVLPAFVDPRAVPWADGATRVLTTLKMAAWYAWLVVLPYPTNLYYEVGLDTVPPQLVWWLAVAALGTMLALTAWAVRRWPAVGFGAAWFWIGLIPVLGGSVLPTLKPLMADRFV
jgi:4-amino-4-deoxy-L-arabinose transferase-like glycosyltransferase